MAYAGREPGGRAAVIDLGFNSLKLVNYNVRPDGSFESFEQYSTLAQIGEGLDRTGVLGEERIRETIEELKVFRSVLKMHSIDSVAAVATSAVREAGNRDEFLSRVRREAGFEFRVLSEKEEGFYSWLGAAAALRSGDTLFFDLGGGSLELVSSRRGRPAGIVSLPLGALRVTQKFSRKGAGPLTRNGISKLRKHAEDVIDEGMIQTGGEAAMVGVGGTLRAVARYCQELSAYPIYKLHNYSLGREDIRRAIAGISSMSMKEMGRVEAFRGGRSRTVLAGACVIDALMEAYGFREVTVSTHGLRDGVLMELLGRSHELRVSGRGRTAATGMKGTSGTLAQRLRMAGKLADREILILERAMDVLARRGRALRPESLFYASLYEDSFLTHREQLIASLSIIHMKKPRIANWLFVRHRAILKNRDRRVVRRLAVLLELMEEIENSGGHVHLSGGRGMRLEVGGRERRALAEILRTSTGRVNDIMGTAISVNPSGTDGRAVPPGKRKSS